MAGPPETPDFTALARRPSQRLAIVEHVLNTGSLQETHCLEWKTGYDLSSRPGAGKTAKHVIGFANRDPAAAARVAEGHAYLLIGVEPGNLVGVPRWDSADVEAWLSRFVQRELAYDIDYVECQGRDVLMLTVSAPEQGDPIYAMQKATGDETFQIAEGAIYVRRGGKTESPTAADIAMLSARASTTNATSLALTLRADASGVVAMRSEQFTDDWRERYLHDRRAKLLAALPKAADPFRGLLSPLGEARDPRTFTASVDQWLAEARKHWNALASCKHLAANDSMLALTLANPTDENFEDVVVELMLPVARVFVWSNAAEARHELKPPEEPPHWGAFPVIQPSLDLLPTLHGPDIDAIADKETRVRFPPVHLYPRAEADLGRVALLVMPSLSGRTLDLRWQASAKNTRGVVSGTVTIDLACADEDGEGEGDGTA